MPQANAHTIPPGLWFHEPTTSSVPRLLLGSATRICALVLAGSLFYGFRYLSKTYTYTNFMGKTLSLGNISRLTHEPLSAEEIDQLKKRQKGLE